MRERDASVLVVGAGPTGLALALVLARTGVPVRIVDRKPGPSRESRALGVQARTLELYRALGLSQPVVTEGLPMGAAEVRVEGRPRPTLPPGRMGLGISPFPYLLIYPQDVHEPILIAALAAVGVEVDWRTSLLGFTPDAEGGTATLERDGQQEVFRTDWLVGADGSRSTVREALRIGFEGGTAEGLFYVADVRAEHLGHTVVLGFGTSRFAVLFPLPGGRARLIGMVPPGAETDSRIDFKDVAPDARRLTGLEARDVAWFSTYHVRHRVAAHFGQGRCFLAGDAGHVHSPLGGQGMNTTGIGDALNLAWKLGAVVRGEASAAILDSYEPERLPFARRLVGTTDAAFLQVADDSWVGRTTRTRIMPAVLAIVSRLDALGPLMFRTISQTRMSYRENPFSEGRWCRLAARDWLPWFKSQDNHAVLNFTWQVHVHGEAGPEFRAWTVARGLPVHVWPWGAEAQGAGLRRNDAVLVRPDGQIGCLGEGAGAVALEANATQWGLPFGSSPMTRSHPRVSNLRHEM